MTMYIARMFFKIHSGADCPQVDEQLRLIHADSKTNALELAQSLGKQLDEESTPSLRWEFLGVREVFLLPGQEHGTELYSRVMEAEEVQAFEFISVPVLAEQRAW